MAGWRQDLRALYRSLIGDFVYMLLTSVDIAVFVVVLQLWNHAQKNTHVKRLNALTEWAQANPMRLVYRALLREGRLAALRVRQRVYADSAFKKD